MVDGVSGTDLYRVIFDFSPEPSPAAAGGAIRQAANAVRGFVELAPAATESLT